MLVVERESRYSGDVLENECLKAYPPPSSSDVDNRSAFDLDTTSTKMVRSRSLSRGRRADKRSFDDEPPPHLTERNRRTWLLDLVSGTGTRDAMFCKLAQDHRS